ncbi:DNA internalization-related competence protein ComEC/Rec2 [Acinetobacter sp. ANC 4558]|uniref:DNA internalization-related competence protein ComEC/Rec2 n=1 Tax=Acinetobacter sp. ANC 4558 TaxID=1977876 RepID=UPI0026D4A342|nr:DNA internalization-related competence protein ComEC/Rec2 [Acinetobacter sp. ANC 4558]
MMGWIIGIACMGQVFTFIPHLNIVGNFIVLFLLFSLYLTNQKVKSLSVQFICFLTAFFMSMILGLNYANSQLEHRLKLRETAIDDATVIVYVKHLPQLKEKGTQQKVEVLNRKSEIVQWFVNIRSEIGVLELGKYYRLAGKIKPAHGYATAGSFDLEKWYIQQNIMGNFRVSSIQEISQEEVKRQGYIAYVKRENSWIRQGFLWIEKQRLEIRNFIQKQPIRNKGLSLALLTGDESLLNKEIEQQFQRFGMSHLLAISGPHVLVFALMISWLIQKIIAHLKPSIYLKIPKQYLLIFPFLLCVVVYCAYVGFEIPALRTLLVCVIGSFFILLKQQLRPLALLLSSACVLLIFDPFSVLSAAFWLSYGACFILLRIYQTLQHEQLEDASVIEKIQRYSWALIESQWKIFIALFPLMVIFFNQISWITPLSNLFSIPWIGIVIVPLDIIAGMTYFFAEPLSRIIFQLNDWMLSLLLGCLDFLDTIFSPQLYPIYLNVWVLCGLFMALITVFMPKGVVPKSWSIFCLVPIFVGGKAPNQFEVLLLDVGQGQSVFIRNANKTMMLDTGGSYNEDEYSIGQQIILPFLAGQNAKQLDILMLSHLDQDHSGAYFKIRDKLKIEKLYANELIDGAQTTELCQKGQKLELGEGVDIRVLSPKFEDLSRAKLERNDMSCVVHIHVQRGYPYQDYLLMGDAGWATEFNILQEFPNLNVDVLVLGHHGSRHSSAYDFLKTLNPKLALISAGFDNRYGHPSGQTIKRLEQLKIPYLSTVQAGTIHLVTDQQGQVTIKTYRQQKKWLSQ